MDARLVRQNRKKDGRRIEAHRHEEQITKMLLRRYVGRRLAEYYAQPPERVVGSTSLSNGTIDFSSLLGEWHWRWIYRRLYRRQRGQWLTPVELFKPYYSNAIANFIANCARQNGSLDKVKGVEVLELGGGRGTNASLVLSHLRAAHRDVYDALESYTLVDSSPTLHELQGQILLEGEHADKVQLLRKDVSDVAEGRWVGCFEKMPLVDKRRLFSFYGALGLTCR